MYMNDFDLEILGVKQRLLEMRSENLKKTVENLRLSDVKRKS